MLNKVMLIGRLGDDPVARILENGTKLVRVSIATSESYKDAKDEWQTKTEWHDLVFWRSLGDRAEKGLLKGQLIYVEGKMRTRRWKTDEGESRQSTDVEVEYFRKLQNTAEVKSSSTQAPPF